MQIAEIYFVVEATCGVDKMAYAKLTPQQRSEIIRWKKELGLSPEFIAKEMHIPLEFVNEVLIELWTPPTPKEATTATKEYRLTKNRAKNLIALTVAQHLCVGYYGPSAAEAREKCVSREYRVIYPDLAKKIDDFAEKDPEGFEKWLRELETYWIGSASPESESSSPEKWRRVIPTLGSSESSSHSSGEKKFVVRYLDNMGRERTEEIEDDVAFYQRVRREGLSVISIHKIK